ncbi:hypothetical protein Patl1_15575 [Pistacia atlantica]|uniref:Uncharacterized protein n=1 Tax=Pistacia atlantica TaxID=434234 RepID=A0ACC1B5P5_9ROSI|nr:hypothetical protein Patl1_15575 [Pistacia atlantica]
MLLGAPRIFGKETRFSYDEFDDPLFNFFKDDPDDKWVRATDFTPSSCIGQSTGLCLELPYRLELPNFKENFGYCKESDGRFDLEIALDSDFYRLVEPSRINKACIEYALDKLYQIKECCYETSKWLTEQYQKYLTTRNRPRSPAITLDGSLVYVHRIQVTPCKVYFCGPEVNVSNRVLRHYRDYIDNFLRISFIDEDLDKIHSIAVAPRSSSANKHRTTGIYTRILSTLENGVVIGDKKFEFLAFSSSQLLENSAWVFASTDGVTAAHIREWMGNFRQIRNVAQYAARLGQSFGSSTETLSVREDEMEVILDVEVITGGTKYVFSDAIGKISVEFARRVAQKCGIKDRPPSAFQIRFGGYKGVVAVEPTSTKKIIIEEKYVQLITLFSTLGVHDKVFEKKQRDYGIFVQNGRSMMGCLDETRNLDYGQVFVQFSKAASQQRYFIEGEVVVAKNPCLHPGDVRVLRAMNVPAFNFMEVQEYFTNYIVNDSLGIIANAHTAFADKEPGKATSNPCIELAKKILYCG